MRRQKNYFELMDEENQRDRRLEMKVRKTFKEGVTQVSVVPYEGVEWHRSMFDWCRICMRAV